MEKLENSLSSLKKNCKKVVSRSDVSFKVSTSTSSPTIPIDDASLKGKFGWIALGDISIPFVLRAEQNLCPISIVHMKIVDKFLNPVSSWICSRIQLRHFKMTATEANLFDEINFKHSNGMFGINHYVKDQGMIAVNAVRELYDFLIFCHCKLKLPSVAMNARCGFVTMEDVSIPYVIKDGTRFVPRFFFEGKQDILENVSAELDAWGCAYMKFCCIVLGVNMELYLSDSCKVISLQEIRHYTTIKHVTEDIKPFANINPLLLSSWTGPGCTTSAVATLKPTEVPMVDTPKAIIGTKVNDNIRHSSSDSSSKRQTFLPLGDQTELTNNCHGTTGKAEKD